MLRPVRWSPLIDSLAGWVSPRLISSAAFPFARVVGEQRAWIKWRDAEADIIARVGGAIGGSALRVDYANAQTKLIKERNEVLRGYMKEAWKSN